MFRLPSNRWQRQAGWSWGWGGGPQPAAMAVVKPGGLRVRASLRMWGPGGVTPALPVSFGCRVAEALWGGRGLHSCSRHSYSRARVLAEGSAAEQPQTPSAPPSAQRRAAARRPGRAGDSLYPAPLSVIAARRGLAQQRDLVSSSSGRQAITPRAYNERHTTAGRTQAR